MLWNAFSSSRWVGSTPAQPLRWIAVVALLLALGCNRSRPSERSENPLQDAGIAPDVDGGDVGVDDAARDVDASGEDAATDDADGDADPGACETVCFTWLDAEPVELPPPGTVRPPVEVRSSVCNPNGLAPGTCPAGTQCEGTEERWRTPTVFVDRATCVTDAAPLALALDAPDVEEGVNVTLAFQWNGEAWPYQGLEGGELTVVDASGARVARLTSWERDPSAVPLRIPPGVYRVSFSPPAASDSVAPILTRAGELRVVTEGTATVDVEGIRVAPELWLDGAVLERSERWAGLLLLLRTPEGFLRTVRLEPSDPIPALWRVQRRPLTLEAVALARRDAPDARAGWLGTSGRMDAEPGEVWPLRVDAQTATYRGTVRVDGAPPGIESTVQVVDAANVLREASVDPQTGEWTLDAFAGEAVAAWAIARDPNQPATLAARTAAVPITTDAPLAIARETTTVRGTLLVEGVPTGAPLARLRFVYDNGDVAEVNLGERGTIAGRALAGIADAWVLGDGILIPAGAQRVREASPIRSDFDLYEIEAVDVALRVDNRTAVPFTAANGAGVVTLSALRDEGQPLALPSIVNDQLQPVETSWAIPADGPPLRARLAPGGWNGEWTPPVVRDPDAAPLGPLVLAPFEAGPSTVEVVAVLEHRALDWQLLAGDRVLTTESEGSAGELQFGDVFVPIPAGLAEGRVALFPGTYDVTYACRATQGCRGIAEAPNRRLLLEGLRVP